MNYYNAVLLYSSFHHGISKCFISINYSTPQGGKWKIDTLTGACRSRLQTGSNPDFIWIQPMWLSTIPDDPSLL